MQRWALQDGGRGPVKMQDGEQARKMGWSSSPTIISGGSTQHPPCSHPPVLMQNQPSRGWAGGPRYARTKSHLPDNAFYWTR